MIKLEEYIKNLYLKNEYLIKNPSLHEEDSPWKIGKIIPLVDEYIKCVNKKEINLLDVGGGAGIILDEVSKYIENIYDINVNKYALDLSPGMLEHQKNRNPDLKKGLNEDIRDTSLDNKEIDLTLVIDLLEHVPSPIKALEELKRISNYVIFKVPLEDNLNFNILNMLKRGKLRKRFIEEYGHINSYNNTKIKKQIEKHTGHIFDFSYTNVFDYYLNSPDYKNNTKTMNNIINLIASYTFKLSPKLCSHIFNDFIMIFVRTYDYK